MSERLRRATNAPLWAACAGLAIALLGPVISNGAPIAARVDGTWHFPALRELAGLVAPPPPGRTWSAFVREPGPEDLCVPAPWPVDAMATDLDRLREGPSLDHPLGTDDTGRDVLARMVRGARTTLGTSLLGTFAAALLGCAIGALSGLRGRVFDVVALRTIEVFSCFPALVLLLAIGACFGDARGGVVAALALATWPSFARVVRGELLSLREREWFLTARELGVGRVRLFVGHVFLQLRGQVAVVAAFGIANGVVAESTLSFLGIGPGVQNASWGAILAQGKADAHLWAWHLWVVPGLAIAAVVWCCHALAERLRARAA